MNRSRPSRSLGRRMLAAFLAVSLVPLLLAALVTYWRSASFLEAFVAESVEKTARAYASDVDLFLERQRQRLQDVSLDDDDRSAVLRGMVAQDAHLDALLVLDESGAVLAQSPADPEGWVTEACRGIVEEPGQAMTHAGRGHAHVVVVGVRRDDAVLCGQVNFTVHQDLLTERANGALGGTAFIVDRTGTVVCHAFEHDQPNRGRGDVLGPTATRAASGRVPWSGPVGDRDDLLAAYAPAASLPWGVWVEVSRDVAAAPLRTWLTQTLGVAFVLALAAAIAAMFLVRRLVAPIQDVAEAARRIGAGTLGEHLPVRGDDEVAELAREFNRMSEALKRSHDELDARVQARTRELGRAREFSDLLLDTMRERILVVDADQNIVRANRAAFEAYGPSLVGCGCHEVHGRAGASKAACPSRRVLERGEPESEERTYDYGDRTEILAVDTFPLPNGDGPPRAVIEIARDVTAERRLQARMINQEKMAALGTLAAGLAHEIGNPLASLSSELEMMEHDWDPDSARQSVPVLRDQVRRMSQLLRELVNLGRPSSDEAAPFDAVSVVEDVARLLRHDPRGEGLEMVVETSDGVDRPLCSARDRLTQVLVNLGLNALDALEGRGRLRFHLAPEAAIDGLRIEVSDDGPGISGESADHVFDPFYTTKEPGEGTGLGLFVSERIVRAIGGTLELDRSPSAGATFVLTLPWCACGDCDPGGAHG